MKGTKSKGEECSTEENMFFPDLEGVISLVADRRKPPRKENIVMADLISLEFTLDCMRIVSRMPD